MKQAVKWTAEGIVKGYVFIRVFYDVGTYVSCRGYDGILLSAWGLPVN